MTAMRWRARTRVFAPAVALAVLAAGCGNASDKGSAEKSSTTGGTRTTSAGSTEKVTVHAPGVTKDEIHLGSVVSKTNPLGGDYDLFNAGVEAYLDQVNSRGGVYGRTLKLTSTRDDKLSDNRGQVEAMLSQDDVYAAFVATLLFTGAPLLAKAGIPTFGWNINAEWAGPENLFPNVAPLCLEGCPLYPHVTPWLAQQSKAHNVAILGYSVPQSASCVKGNVDNFSHFGKDVGAEVVYSDSSLSFGQTDFSAQVAQMKDKHVDFLATCLDFNGDFAVAKEMSQQGIGGKVTFYHANLYNKEFVKANAGPLEGGIVLAQVTAAEHAPAPAAVQEYLGYAAKHDLKVTEATMQGWISARRLVSGLKAAGPDFTWANLIGALNRQTWDAQDGWVVPIDWTRQHRNPADGMQYRSQFECGNFVRIHDGKFVGIYNAGGTRPWVCWDGHKPDVWGQPVNVSFAGRPFTFADAQKNAQK